MDLLRRVRRFLGGSRSADPEPDAVSRCIQCGTGFQKEFTRCPECGSEFVGLVDVDDGNDANSEDREDIDR